MSSYFFRSLSPIKARARASSAALSMLAVICAVGAVSVKRRLGASSMASVAMAAPIGAPAMSFCCHVAVRSICAESLDKSMPIVALSTYSPTFAAMFLPFGASEAIDGGRAMMPMGDCASAVENDSTSSWLRCGRSASKMLLSASHIEEFDSVLGSFAAITAMSSLT